ncbi:hypothetical protein [Corynebacterium renale]|uniref:Uncharacterized protein n=1 Tax=Corynebacterium renale TaxID=1724 RepID=A0A2A9DLB9_9CORY|nr:hypothetical protein [Corynebacterium renale]PFG27393.1 hypothetical protein ATK06_0449 [Corynebacterium renale]SQI23520.1 immunity-specific protein beta201 [Corynebacterium renale]
MAYSITYTSPAGDLLDLTGADSTVAIERAALSGLVGTPTTQSVTSPYVPGEIITGTTTGKMTGSLGLLIDVHEVDAVYSRVRAAFSHTTPGILSLLTSTGDTWACHVTQDGAIPAPESDPDHEWLVSVTVPLVCHTGVWQRSTTLPPGTHLIANDGDVPLSPTVAWQGSNSKVSLPSAVTMRLPSAPSMRTVNLDGTRGGVVCTPDGTQDLGLTRALEFIPSSIPPGTQAAYTATNATLSYVIGIWDPWKRL